MASVKREHTESKTCEGGIGWGDAEESRQGEHRRVNGESGKGAGETKARARNLAQGRALATETRRPRRLMSALSHRTLLIVKAGDHWSFRMSRQMDPFALIFG